MSETNLFRREFTLERLLLRLALAVGLLLLSVQIAALTRIDLANNFVLIGLSALPVIALLGGEEVLQWTATRSTTNAGERLDDVLARWRPRRSGEGRAKRYEYTVRRREEALQVQKELQEALNRETPEKAEEMKEYLEQTEKDLEVARIEFEEIAVAAGSLEETLKQLSVREKAVLQEVAVGKNFEQIASNLRLPRRTILTIYANGLKKLGPNHWAQLTALLQLYQK